MHRLLISMALLLLAVSPACAQEGTAKKSYTVLSGDISDLRARFNADQSKVRAIFIAAPT
jgi:hypothetical protein